MDNLMMEDGKECFGLSQGKANPKQVNDILKSIELYNKHLYLCCLWRDCYF